MRTQKAIVVGAGIGGLSAAVDLARAGMDVRVLERAESPGGRMRRQGSADHPIDAGPTVFTMRWVFESLFADAGRRLDEALDLHRLDLLARHQWQDGGVLDLFEDVDRTVDAIGNFSGARDAAAYRRFAADSAHMFDVLDAPFMRAQRPDPVRLTLDIGLHRLPDLLATRPFTTLWTALGEYFEDERLRQLFGRYATYCGADPFTAPATLMLIAHAERAGVWHIDGGMYARARALEGLAGDRGARFEYGRAVARLDCDSDRVRAVVTEDGERIETDVVIYNGEVGALAAGALGDDAAAGLASQRQVPRSLSAVTYTGRARTSGFPLAHHTVFFSRDYAAEFDAISRSGTPGADPTIYICAQDRSDTGDLSPGAEADGERLLMLINARADGDRTRYDDATADAIKENVECRLRASGLELGPANWTSTTPADFETAFPGSGGALYGRAIQGFMASFQRPGGRTRIPGLYLAGGGVHPGAGVPMVATSGRLAASAAVTDLVSTSRFRTAVTTGGTSTV